MNKVLICLVISLMGYSSLAQNQNNIWNFGLNCNINFNTNPPSSAAGSQLATNEGSAVIADAQTGALLFYTDGITVWNANNQVMPNGSGLLGGNTGATNVSNPYSSTSAAVIVPRPFTPNIYYIFTIDQEDSTNGLCYSVVDMTLNGGLGDVVATQKNIPLLSTTSEKLQAVPNASGCGYWLITHNNPGNTFFAFAITQSGVATTAVQSTIGSFQTNGRGHIKVNQQLTKLAMGNSAFSERKIELFDFNNETGVISNVISWSYSFPFSGTDFAGLEFSPDGSKLYASNFIRILQYDVSLASAALIGASGIEISSSEPTLTVPGTMQLAPDNKIYISSTPLAVINNPNSSGAASGLQLNPISGFLGTVRYGLPQKIYTLQPSVPTFNPIAPICAGETLNPLPTTSLNGISGSWAPVLNNLATTTYTFTPNAGSCADTASLEIVVNSITIPSFDPIPSFCAGTTPPTLPTTSLNGIQGTWTPATVNNTASADYTFNPNSGQCAAFVSLSTTVLTCGNNQILNDSSCQFEVITFSLQDTANVLAVSWNFGDESSGGSNLANGLIVSRQYFSSGEFVVTATVTTNSGGYVVEKAIQIIPAISLTFNTPIELINGSVAPALPTTSNQGIQGTWSPNIIDTTSSGSYVFTPSVPGCYVDNQIFISIVDCFTPAFNILPNFCENTPSPALPTTSLNGIVGTWLPSVVSNTASGTYTFTPSAGQNACSVSREIQVLSGPPTLTLTSAPQTLNQTVCVNQIIETITYELGGSATNASITNLPNGVFGSVSGTTLTISGIALTNAATFDFTITTIGTCTGSNVTTSGTIEVTGVSNPAFSIPTTICFGATPPVLPTTSLNGIAGTWSPAVVSSLSTGVYTFTPNVGTCASSSSLQVTINVVTTPVTPTFNPIAPICIGSTPPVLQTTSLNGIIGSWLPATVSNLTTATYTFIPEVGQCVSTSPVELTIIVESGIVPTFNDLPAICEGSVAPVLPTTSLNGITGTWFPSIVNNLSTSTYVFTPAAGQCSSVIPIEITVVVNAPIVPVFSPISQSICANSPVPSLPTTSLNGITGTWSPPIISNISSGNYTFTPSTGQCASTNLVTISVDVTPLLTPLFDITNSICFGTAAPILPTTSLNGIVGSWSPPTVSNSATGIYTFIPSSGQCTIPENIQLTINVETPITPVFEAIPSFCSGSIAPILPTTSVNGITGSWSPAVVNNSASSVYMFTAAAGQCVTNTNVQIQITVKPIVELNFQSIAPFCAGTTAPVLPVTSLNGIAGTWSPAQIDNQTSGTYTFTANSSANFCYPDFTLNVSIVPQQLPDFEDLELCKNQTDFQLSTVSPNGISGSWSPSVIDFVNGGNYTFVPNATQCSAPQTITVTIKENVLLNFEIKVSEPFSENITITAIALNPGNFLYQLDSGEIQESNIFENVTSGFHTVRIIDADGCSDDLVFDEILVVDYPKFFTPNGDGFNDFWNINALIFQRESKIFIYDRYGKLITQIFPFATGWDGTFNGNELPSTDYWFVVEFAYNNKNRQFRSHFTLKR